MEIKNNAKGNATLELGDILEVDHVGLTNYYLVVELNQDEFSCVLVSLSGYSEVDAYESLSEITHTYPQAKIHKSKNVELIIN